MVTTIARECRRNSRTGAASPGREAGAVAQMRLELRRAYSPSSQNPAPTASRRLAPTPQTSSNRFAAPHAVAQVRLQPLRGDSTPGSRQGRTAPQRLAPISRLVRTVPRGSTHRPPPARSALQRLGPIPRRVRIAPRPFARPRALPRHAHRAVTCPRNASTQRSPVLRGTELDSTSRSPMRLRTAIVVTRPCSMLPGITS